jgi:F-type H+-transporting ATPase subunit a
VTSSALALVQVLAAEGGGGDSGFQAPGLGEFYPEVIGSFSVLGVPFEITRITIILWVATLAISAFL